MKTKRTSPARETCIRCGDSVARGCRKYVNRIPDGDTGDWICQECDTGVYCKTCGSEVVETVNDSAFRDGECGPCEFARYKSQPELLAHLENIIEMSHSVAANWESGDLAAAVRNLDRIATAAELAITKAHGNAE